MRQQRHYLAVLWVCLSVGLLFPALAGATDTLGPLTEEEYKLLTAA